MYRQKIKRPGGIPMQNTYHTYRSYALILFFSMMITGVCVLNLKGVDLSRKLSGDVFQMTFREAEEAAAEEKAQKETFVSRFGKIWKSISSPERTVDYEVLVNENAVLLSEEDYEILCRIVEAEAGNEDEKGRMLVARVIINRVESSRFPNSVKGVVFQKSGNICQFSPVANGSYYHVTVSEKTRNAVEKVLRGEDESQGALFFVNRSAAKGDSMNWFDTKCTPLFSYGRHEFFS